MLLILYLLSSSKECNLSNYGKRCLFGVAHTYLKDYDIDRVSHKTIPKEMQKALHL